MSAPALSAVCLLGSRRDRLEKLGAALAAQSARDQLELILVAADQDVKPPKGLRSKCLRWPEGASYGEARAVGVREAEGEIVAFLLDHGYPESDWAEALIRAYGERPWAAVGYRFRIANPATYASRATYLAHFGAWEGIPRGETALLPGNMVSYRRSELDDLGAELGSLLETDSALHRRLAQRGLRIGIEPDANVAVECFESLLDACRANAVYAVVLAAERARLEGWSLGRRLFQGVMAPGVATGMRLIRVWRGSARPRRRLIRNLPALVAICFGWALGEARGYLLGAAHAKRRLVYWELDATRARA